MIATNQHLIKNLNNFIDSSSKDKLFFKNSILFKNEKSNGWYRCRINNHEYWILFLEAYNDSTTSSIRLCDSTRENPSIIQYAMDKSNFKINGNRFNLIQNRGLTISRKILGLEKIFKDLMYDQGFSKENIIATGNIIKPDYNDVIGQIFNWLTIRSNVKFQLEEEYRDIENKPIEEELGNNTQLDILSRTEGGIDVRISVRAERDRVLREAAIKIHGLICQACGFNFGEVYGHWGKGYIEVHHSVPLSEGERETNPKIDLAVVCSNCHRMIHKKRNITLTIDELKEKLSKS